MSDQRFVRVSRTYTHTINAAPDVVFPLLCPVREAEYLDAWEYEIIFSESGVAERGCVFQTPGPDGDSRTWIITEHDAVAGRIQFAIVTPASHASTLDVSVESAQDQTTSVVFTYTHTAISDRGLKFVDSFTEEFFHRKMSVFEESLNKYVTIEL